MISNNRPLTLEIYNSLSNEQRSKFTELLSLECYEDDEYLVESDYVIFDLEINTVKYTMIHGFPGDNPAGVIFNENESYDIRNQGDNKNEVYDWYNKTTENGSNFEDSSWYASPRDTNDEE